MSINHITVRAAYVNKTLEICHHRGIDVSLMAKHLDSDTLKDPKGRVKLVTLAPLYYEAHRHFSALGYELGTQLRITSHGFIGYGLLTQNSMAEMANFALEHADLVAPFSTISFSSQENESYFEFSDAVDLGPLRQPCMELCLITLWNIFEFMLDLLELNTTEFILKFDNPKPDYHDDYSKRLPVCEFSTGGYRLCFPTRLLPQAISTADIGSALLSAEQSQQERDRAGRLNQTRTAQIREILKDKVRPPSFAHMAACLSLSERSLSRKLKAESTSYQRLAEQHCKNYACNKLVRSHMPIHQIASELGYADPANFTRAFRKWTGMTPQAMRLNSG